jgi:hypothetical protein
VLEGSMLARGIELGRGAVVILGNELARCKLDTLIASKA